MHDRLTLADWRRRVAAMYEEIRSTPDPVRAWERWRAVRNDLFREHPQSPLAESERGAFAGLPFFDYDPVACSVRDPKARERMVAGFSIHDTVPSWAVAYEFDIYLRGPAATPFAEAW